MEETDARCPVCGGTIIKETIFEQGPDAPLGPASGGSVREKISYHCRDCGIVYKFLPQSPEK